MLALVTSLLVVAGCAAPPSASPPNDVVARPIDRPGEYDYIVVGSGAGGGPLAARLARAGERVLLLEAGEDVGGSQRYQVPAMHALSTEDPAMAWWYFVQHHTEPGLDAEDSKHTPEGILYPRGSALGGSTAVNAMVTVRAPPADWDRLAVITGDRGWRASAVAPHHALVEAWLSPSLPPIELAEDDPFVLGMLASAASVHAGEGPLDLDAHPLDVHGTAGELARLAEQDVNDALAHGETEGLYRLPLATRDGRRRGTRELLLETVAEGHPLTIWTRAYVRRVILTEDATPRAIGVEYVRGGAPYRAGLAVSEAIEGPTEVRAEREVILAAGVYNTPQLLMLSGVGDPDALADAGIAARVALPGVGRNLQDRYEIAVVAEVGEDLPIVDGCRLGQDGHDPCVDDWERGEGPYQTSGFLATVLRRARPEDVQPNLHVFAAPGDVRGYYPGYSADALRTHDRWSWLVLEAHTTNRDGYVRIASDDPYERPDIHFRSFDEASPESDPELRALVSGVRFVRDTLARMRRTEEGAAVREIWPGPEVATDEAIAAFARREAWGHHACCTSPMGADGDPGAVLDARLRVRGVEALRVVDASSFPEIPGTFLAHPIFVLSERAAELILEDRR